MQDDFAHELDTAVAVARGAADLIRRHRPTLAAGSIHEKGRHDLVTDVDLLSQEFIISALKAKFPRYGFVAEEDGVRDPHAQSFRRWIIDPIDGTTNFTHGVPPYSVSIALVDGSDPVVGVVLEVVSGETFTAVRGEGSYLDGNRIRVSRTSGLGEALISTGFPYRSVDHVDEYLAVLRAFMTRCRGVRRHGSAAVDLAYLSCGRFDGFFETGLMPWDVAAGILLIEEAGGTVSTFSGEGRPLSGAQIMASNGLLHAEMKEALVPLAGVFD